MAKLRAGSIVKKGAAYYLVYRSRWIALKTKNYEEAERRAVEFLPGLADPDIEWLEYLVSLGDKAKAKLAAKTAPKGITWLTLYHRWTAGNKRLTSNPDSLRAYEGQIKALAQWAENSAISAPERITHAEAAEYLATRSAEAQKRDCALFSRIYGYLGLDAAAWDRKSHNLAIPEGERYRRITRDEFASLLAAADTLQERALLLLGYTTGMRLGTCLAISAGNMQGDYIEIVPGKTRAQKPRPLIIPLLPDPGAALKAVAPDYFAGMRPDITSNRLTKIFRTAGVESNQFGRASFHSLRATFISMMDEAGIPPHITDAITGHASQGMHGRYSQPAKAALTAAVQKAFGLK